jgi:preprotein translocase subunit YajC
MVGKITKVSDDFIVLEVADNVSVRIQKVAISGALPKGSLKDI